MKILFTNLILIFTCAFYSFSQTNNFSSLQGELVISLNGGITIPRTDFKDVKASLFGIGTVEYYFRIKSLHALGIRLNGGIGSLKGIDERHTPNEFIDNIFFIGGGLVYSYSIDNIVLPYLFVGASNVWYNPQDNNGNSIVPGIPVSERLSKINYNGELGLKINLNKKFSVNISCGEFICPGDQLDGINAGLHNDVFLYGTIGFSFSFLGATDSDNDGVWDSEDACPDTPGGVKVDLLGCPVDTDKDGVPDYMDKCSLTPAGVAVDIFGCPVDVDKDGVPDYMDNCPDSPIGVSVDALGCVKDFDKDNVPDYMDKCPDTPAGIKVDSSGCPEDLNRNGIPDYLEKKKSVSIFKTASPGYNLQNEHLVRDMIFTDGKLYTAQISAWRDKSKADIEARKLIEMGYDAFVAGAFIEKWNQTWYRVRVGYFRTFREAQDLAHKLR